MAKGKMTPQEFRQEFHEAFGNTELTHDQLWWLVKFAKHVRLRARNNSAFNNLMNGMWPHATFKEVTKQRQDGSTYPGLQITVAGKTSSLDEE